MLKTMERKIRDATCRLGGINFLSRFVLPFVIIVFAKFSRSRLLDDESKRKKETGRSRENGRESWRGRGKGKEGNREGGRDEGSEQPPGFVSDRG